VNRPSLDVTQERGRLRFFRRISGIYFAWKLRGIREAREERGHAPFVRPWHCLAPRWTAIARFPFEHPTGTEEQHETTDNRQTIRGPDQGHLQRRNSASEGTAQLIVAAQRVEHYEISAYGSARAFAQHLRHAEVVELLQTTLDEESAADEKLTSLCEEEVLPMANEVEEPVGH
jgi:hypothetical protein